MRIMACGRKCLYYTLRPYLLRWAAPAWLATAVPGPLSPATRPLMGLGTSGDPRPGVHGPRNKNNASREERVASVYFFPLKLGLCYIAYIPRLAGCFSLLFPPEARAMNI